MKIKEQAQCVSHTSDAHTSLLAGLGKRWRNLFLQYAAEEPAAVAAASRRENFGLLNDSRPVAQRLAEKFLKLPLPAGAGLHEWQLVTGASPSVKPMPTARPLPDLSSSATLLFIPGGMQSATDRTSV